MYLLTNGITKVSSEGVLSNGLSIGIRTKVTFDGALSNVYVQIKSYL